MRSLGLGIGLDTLTTAGASTPSGPIMTGLQLWMDANVGVASSGGNVSTWTDQSPNGFVMTGHGPPTTGTGINGKKTVDFNNSYTQSTALVSSIITASAYTVFSAFNFTGSSYITSSPSNGPGLIEDTANYWGVIVGTSVGSPSTPGVGGTLAYFSYNYLSNSGWGVNVDNFVKTVPHYACTRLLSGNLNAKLDGAAATTLAASNVQAAGLTHAFYVGGGVANFVGSIGEVLVYNRGLSDSEVTTMESYLKAKWGF